MSSWTKWGLSLIVAIALIWVGWRMTFILVTLHVAVCFVLVIVIMLQSGSAADLAGAFGGAGSQTAFGPRGAATILSQATTWCAVMFMICAMAMVLRTDKAIEQGGSVLHQISRPAPAKTPATTPVAPATTPAPSSHPPASNSAPVATQPAPS